MPFGVTGFLCWPQYKANSEADWLHHMQLGKHLWFDDLFDAKKLQNVFYAAITQYDR